MILPSWKTSTALRHLQGKIQASQHSIRLMLSGSSALCLMRLRPTRSFLLLPTNTLYIPSTFLCLCLYCCLHPQCSFYFVWQILLILQSSGKVPSLHTVTQPLRCSMHLAIPPHSAPPLTWHSLSPPPRCVLVEGRHFV